MADRFTTTVALEALPRGVDPEKGGEPMSFVGLIPALVVAGLLGSLQDNRSR